MENILLHLHSILRWVILILLLAAVFRSFGAGNKPFTNSHRKNGLFLMITCDIMLLIGLVQWFTGNFGLRLLQDKGMSIVMKNTVMRFFAIEHPIMMLAAIVLVHVGYSFSKKDIPAAKKHGKVVLFYILALLVILVSIPWPFRFAGRGWF